jgi:hypothetical protein
MFHLFQILYFIVTTTTFNNNIKKWMMYMWESRKMTMLLMMMKMRWDKVREGKQASANQTYSTWMLEMNSKLFFYKVKWEKWRNTIVIVVVERRSSRSNFSTYILVCVGIIKMKFKSYSISLKFNHSPRWHSKLEMLWRFDDVRWRFIRV